MARKIKTTTKVFACTADFDYLHGGHTYTATFRDGSRRIHFENNERPGATHLQGWQFKQALASGALVEAA